MMAHQAEGFDAGTRVRVIQQTPLRDRTWTQDVEGVVIRCRQAKTGSWFAHAKDDQYWLDRLELRLDDGEIATNPRESYSQVFMP